MGRFRDKFGAGILGKGNPYKGGLEQGIAYDLYEIDYPIVQQNIGNPKILFGYQYTALDLLKHFSIPPNPNLLEIGCGTGIGTLEMLLQNPTSKVLCVEDSEGMINIAKYKFHQVAESSILNQATNKKLLRYWKEFRSKSKPFKNKVEFIKSKFEDASLKPSSIDYAIAFSSFYHTNLSKSFKKLKTYLKDGKYILWDGSSHFYDDKEFPSNIYGFRYHKILDYILKEVNKKVKVIGDYKDLSRPKYSLDEIKQISLKEDFITEKIATYLSPVDLQVFIKNFVPHIIRKLVSREIEDREFNLILKKSLGNVISNQKALEDNTHKYGIKAIFRSTKIKL